MMALLETLETFYCFRFGDKRLRDKQDLFKNMKSEEWFLNVGIFSLKRRSEGGYDYGYTQLQNEKVYVQVCGDYNTQ